MKTVPVVIAGGGPVGMTLAVELASRGIRSMVVERNQTTTRHPKMDNTNVRSMELFRRLGLADEFRRVAVPESENFDVSWVTTMNGYQLHRFPYKSPAQYREAIRTHNDGSMPLEPAMRVSQVEIEPVLKTRIDADPLVDVRFGIAFEEFREDADGVLVTLRHQDSGETETVRCQYLAGCDGGGSKVRNQLDIKLQGEFQIMQRFTSHFRSDARDMLQRWGPTWHYQSVYGTMIAQNGHDVWTIHTRVADGVDSDSINPHDMIEQFIGKPIDCEVLVCNSWSPHLVVAESYGRGRVFLAGDAGHQYIPTGGYGMNTGVCDAVDLGWKLAAVLKGFGGPNLLPSVDTERRPIGERNCREARRHNDVRVKIGTLYRGNEPLLNVTNSEGDALRQSMAREIERIGNAENESYGIELGYRYQDSPIVVDDGSGEHYDDPLIYTPNTVPGARLPSVFLNDGTALFDKLGLWFTLLVFEQTPCVEYFTAAADKLNIPLTVVHIDQPGLLSLYHRKLILVRPDQHIAWRGDAIEQLESALRVLMKVTGHNVL